MESVTKITSYLTPFKVALVVLCMMYCDGQIKPDHKVIVMSDVIASIDCAGDKENFLEVGNGVHTLQDMLSATESIQGVSIYAALVERLWQFRNLDELFDFFDSLNDYIRQQGEGDDEDDVDDHDEGEENSESKRLLVTASSIIGMFFRKCNLAFSKFNFDQITEFWQAFKRYRHGESTEPSQPDIIGEEGEEEEALTSLAEILEPQSPLTVISHETLDNMMEYYALRYSEKGSAIPEKVREKLNDLIRSEQNLPSSAYFVQYLDACYNRDYEQAFEFLHRFYDYSMDNRGRTHYQYALFTLAILQGEFGSPLEAIRAAEEAIAVARENMDNSCLTQIVSWLYSYLRNHPEVPLPSSFSSLDQMSSFLLARSKETSPNLFAMSCQSEAIRLMGSGGSVTDAFEYLVKSAAINLRQESTTSAELHMVKSTLWNRCGNMILSDLYLDVAGKLKTSALLHTLKALSRNARQLFSKGDVDGAIKLIEELKQVAGNSPAHQHIWLPPTLLVSAKKSLNENKLSETRVILTQLHSFSHLDIEMAHELEFLEIQLEVATGSLARALSMAERGVNKSMEHQIDILYRLRYMLLYVRILLKSELPTRALSAALKSYRVAEQSGIVPLALESLILLAQIMCTREEYNDAAEIIDKAMPRIFETNRIGLVAEAFETLSQAMGDNPRLISNQDRLKFAYEYNSTAAQHYEQERNLRKLSEVCARQRELADMLQDRSRQRRVDEVSQRLAEQLRLNAAVGVI